MHLEPRPLTAKDLSCFVKTIHQVSDNVKPKMYRSIILAILSRFNLTLADRTTLMLNARILTIVAEQLATEEQRNEN